MWHDGQHAKLAIMKYSCNVDRVIEHIRQNVAWELSCEWWVEGNEKWIWNVSSERWREAARRYENITGTLRANIDASIWRWLIHYVHAPRPVNGKKVTFNIYIYIFIYTQTYIIIKFRCRLLPPPSQFRQSNTSSCKQFTQNTERH